MGTRADFYVGRGAKAEWLGSVAYDGYPDDFEVLLGAKSETDWREAVAHMFEGRDDVTVPAQGWPWPWPDSNTTDFAYSFDEGKTWIHKRGWLEARDFLYPPNSRWLDEWLETPRPKTEFPRLGGTFDGFIAPGDHRSGALLFTKNKPDGREP
jgi:hypothetical protein